MITAAQYFQIPGGGEKDHLPVHAEAADGLLEKVNRMLDDLGWSWPIDPDTGCCISGSRGGAGDGGFRSFNSKTGATHSQHREGHAVDVFDPENKLDNMLTDEILEQYDLYRETPTATNGWCHLQDVPPHSRRRTYQI